MYATGNLISNSPGQEVSHQRCFNATLTKICGESRSRVGLYSKMLAALLTAVVYAEPEIEFNYKESTLKIVRFT